MSAERREEIIFFVGCTIGWLQGAKGKGELAELLLKSELLRHLVKRAVVCLEEVLEIVRQRQEEER